MARRHSSTHETTDPETTAQAEITAHEITADEITAQAETTAPAEIAPAEITAQAETTDTAVAVAVETTDADNTDTTAEDNAAAAAATTVVKLRLPDREASTDFTVPRRTSPGYVLTAQDALFYDRELLKLSANTYNARLKTRATKYASASSDAERALYAPQSEEEIGAEFREFWLKYVWKPQAEDRETKTISRREQLTREIGWKFWIELVNQHNLGQATGEPPIFEGAEGVLINIPHEPQGVRRLVKVSIDAWTTHPTKLAHDAAVAAYEAEVTGILNFVMAKPAYAEIVNRRVDAKIAAEKAAKEAAKAPAAPAATSSGTPLVTLSLADLLARRG